MLTRWSDLDRTLAAMDELRRRMDRVFDETGGVEGRGLEETFSRSLPPRVNVLDTGANVVVKAELPGLSEKDVRLSIFQDVISLEGERASDAPEGYAVHRQERTLSKFSRSFKLPCKVDAEKTSASIKDGVLTVTLPKAAEAQPRQIAVRAS